MENGMTKSIAEVQIGDRILSADAAGKTSFSDVVYVPHGANTIEATFVMFTTETGRNVKMTTNHFLPAGQCGATMTVRRADAVSADDCIMTVDGAEKVMDTVTMQGKGIYTYLQTLDVEEKALRGRLDRQKNDATEAAETRARIAAIGDERAVLGARSAANASANTRAAQSVTGPAFRAQPVAVDDLARIGLFRGGGGESQLSYLKEQLAELKDANRTLNATVEAIRQL
jgi:hypothetical protein